MFNVEIHGMDQTLARELRAKIVEMFRGTMFRSGFYFEELRITICSPNSTDSYNNNKPYLRLFYHHTEAPNEIIDCLKTLDIKRFNIERIECVALSMIIRLETPKPEGNP